MNELTNSIGQLRALQHRLAEVHANIKTVDKDTDEAVRLAGRRLELSEQISALEDEIKKVPEITNYKGFEIRTTPNGIFFCALIYKDGQPLGGSFESQKDKVIAKAKEKIDAGKYVSNPPIFTTEILKVGDVVITDTEYNFRGRVTQIIYFPEGRDGHCPKRKIVNQIEWSKRENFNVVFGKNRMGDECWDNGIHILPLWFLDKKMFELKTQIRISKVAEQFCKILKKEVGAKTFAAIQEENRKNTSKTACVTHDYLDANEVMADAFEKVIGHFADVEDEADVDIWNTAWERARLANFNAKSIPFTTKVTVIEVNEKNQPKLDQRCLYKDDMPSGAAYVFLATKDGMEDFIILSANGFFSAQSGNIQTAGDAKKVLNDLSTVIE